MAGSALIIAIGIFTMAAMFDTMLNLTGQIQAYYERAELGDIFCTVEGITDAELKRTEEIPGIRKAAGRMAARMAGVAAVGAGKATVAERNGVHQFRSFQPPFPGGAHSWT